MTIRPIKCILGASCIDFLGHRLEQGVLGLHEENVEKIKNAPRPGTKKQVRSFVGLAGYCMMRSCSPFAAQAGNCQERNYSIIERVPSGSLGYQEISSLFLRSSPCSADGS